MADIINKFVDLKNPSAYAGINAIKRELDDYSTQQISDELHKNRTWSLFKSRKLRFKRLKFQPSGFFTDISFDLADMQKLGRYNNGYRYILVVVEMLSRRLFTIPIKNKGADSMLEAFEELFKILPYKPWCGFSDRGREFLSKKLQAYFKKLNFTHKLSHDPVTKAAQAERAILSLKQRLYKYMTQNNTNNWINVLSKITASINASLNRTLGVSPNEITMKNWTFYWNKLYKNLPVSKKSNLKVGQVVRIFVERTPFTKIHTENFTEQLYLISKVLPTNPVTYNLTTLEGKKLKGKYYAEELTKTIRESDYRIEKILRRRTHNGIKQLFVSWKNQPKSENCWINSGDIVS